MRIRVLALPFAILLSTPAAAAADLDTGAPVAVSPGLAGRFAPILDRCPTFSWSRGEAAGRIELLVYRVDAALDGSPPGLGAPAIRVELPGGASAWTPSLDECLAPGGRYSWLVRPRGADGRATRASEPRLFRVAWAAPAAGAGATIPLSVAPAEPSRDARLGRPAPRPAGDGQARRAAAAPGPEALAAFSAALTAANAAGSGIAHGLVGTTGSGDGAGVAADNTAGGADLLLGAADAAESAAVTESGLERSSAGDLTFDFRNAGAGSMTLRVDSTDVLTAATGAAAAHAHAGEDVTSGTVAEARIDADVARDGEILPAVLAGDGPGSGLDADLLDGSDATAFAPAAGSASYVATGGDTMTGTLTLSPAAGDALVTTAGDVGIGTASPGKPLHVEGLGAMFNMPQVATPITTPFFSIETDVYSTTAGILSVLDRRQQTLASRTPILRVENANGSTDATNPLLEALAAGTTRMVLQQNGNLGLHTASPSHPFHLRKFLNGAHLIASIENTGPFSAAALKLKTPAAGNDWNLVAQETGAGVARGWEVQNASFATPPLSISAATGNVGINVLSAADKLQVAGDIRVGTGTSGCVKDADGSVIAGTCSSDARLKKNIAPLAGMLERITGLTPVTFDWRADEFPHLGLGEARQIGLVAQQVAEVMPELVAEDDDGFLRVSYSELPLLLLQALREQVATTGRLRREIEALSARLAALEADPADP